MKTIAFIPVRGGSKSIPLKNIKLFCGKPLVCWNIEALEACTLIDEIIIATDSDKIEETISKRAYTKTKIYRRSSKNACDTASTESVMLEYISYAKLDNEDIFILAQATSPLTETHHFTEALDLYLKNKYDSLLTCVKTFRFFWNEDGTSKNYDYRHRPRRQDFNGDLMENGAFYINKVGNILKDNNRLSGNIGIYIMPEYTATEIDEPEDWIILESIKKRHSIKTINNNNNIKLFLSDVDGTLTDGGMYYSNSGEEMKKFNTKDGMGFQLLRNHNIKTGFITSENTEIVKNRAKKLKVDFLIQGKAHEGKLSAVSEICKETGISLDEIAYIGDDINCFDLLNSVGIAACPADANTKIQSIKNIKIMNKKGGEGCVREFIEYLLNLQK